jgi:5'-nucleotidase
MKKDQPSSDLIPSGWLWLIVVVILLGGPILMTWLNCGKTNAGLEVQLLQVNDVYEIAGIDNGTLGAMSRIATLKKQLLRRNPNTLLILAGDFISPSVFNNVRQDSAAVAGKQMIEAMNAAGFDLVIFGNHEFDFKYKVLQQRMDESSFQWLSSNVRRLADTATRPFQQQHHDLPTSWSKTFTDEEGRSATIGFIGLTLPDNPGDPKYASYTTTLAAAKELYDQLSKTCDAVVAVTHQDINDDVILADSIPELTAILGGHEHDMRFQKEGEVYITKAHANAKTAFQLKITFNGGDKRPTVVPSLIPIDSTLAKDPLTAAVVDKWMDVAKDYFKGLQFHPDSSVCPGFVTPLDGRDISIRSKPTNLSRFITSAMLWATRGYHTKAALMNAGSIRVDDIITPPVTEYSFLRALPYSGAIQVAWFRGFFLRTVLDSAARLTGDGAFLQFSDNTRKDPSTGKWTIDNRPLADSAVYPVAIADYLIKGRQKKLEFIKKGQPGVDSVFADPTGNAEIRSDVVKATIGYLRSSCPAH